MFHFQNGDCLAFMFSSFLVTLFLLPTERRNKIRVRKGKFFDECVGSVSADVSVTLKCMTSQPPEYFYVCNKMQHIWTYNQELFNY